LRHVEVLTNSKLLDSVLEVFKERADDLTSSGWCVSDAQSLKWWGCLGSVDEIFITAVLVQLSRWEAVVKALENLKVRGLLSLDAINEADEGVLRDVIKPVGLRGVKTRRLKELAIKVKEVGGLDKLSLLKDDELRDFLLSIDGIGEETADALLLFAFNRATIPISRYVVRVLSRVGVIEGFVSYEKLRKELINTLNGDLYKLKLLYSGLTHVGKTTCLPKQPDCMRCVLSRICRSSTVKN